MVSEAPPGQPTFETHALLDDARYGAIDNVLVRLKSGEDIDINFAHPDTGLTVLHYAAAYSSLPVIRALAASGHCDFLRPDRKGRTAARLAFEVADNPVLGRYLYDQEYAQRQREGARGERLHAPADANFPAKTD